MAWRFHLKVEPWADKASLFGVFEQPPFGGTMSPGVVQQLIFKAMPEGAFFGDPETMLQAHPEDVKDFLRAMADCAYENGILPTRLQNQDGADKAELGAVRSHLDDMRAIVSKCLKAPLNERG